MPTYKVSRTTPKGLQIATAYPNTTQRAHKTRLHTGSPRHSYRHRQRGHVGEILRRYLRGAEGVGDHLPALVEDEGPSVHRGETVDEV